METRQRVSGVAHSAAPRGADTEAFLATVRTEQARFIEALGQAATVLGQQSTQLQPALAAQIQLTRQFLDAQRSILQLRAETDKELALIGTVPCERADAASGQHDQVVAAQRQHLSQTLDTWWVEENVLRRTVLNDARRAVHEYLAHLATSDTVDAAVLPGAATRVLAELEVGDAGDLHALLDELIQSLDSSPAVAAVSQASVAADPSDLHFIDFRASETFVEFWAQRESTEPKNVTPQRRRFLPQAVYPVVAVASLLTITARNASPGVFAAARASMGGPAQYEVTVTVKNTSTVPLAAVSLAGSVGRSNDQLATLAFDDPGLLAPGRSWQQVVTTKVPGPSFGSLKWEVAASGAGPTVTAIGTTTQRPTLLIVIVLFLVADVFLLAIRFRTRRRQRSNPRVSSAPQVTETLGND